MHHPLPHADRAARRGSPRGVAIATALMVLTVISVIGLAIAAIGAQDLNLATADRNYTMCRYAAEAGIADSVAQLLGDPAWNAGFSDKSLIHVPGFDLGYSVSVTNNYTTTGSSREAEDGTVVAPGMVYLHATGAIRGGQYRKAVGALYHVRGDALFKYAAYGIDGVELSGTSSVSNSFDSSSGPYSATNRSDANCDVATGSTASDAITYNGHACNMGTAYGGFGGNPSFVIDGTVGTNCLAMASLPAPVVLPVPVSPLVATTTDYAVSGRSITLVPGSYGDLRTPSHCTVEFAPGVYSFRSVNVGSQNTINGPATGRAIIYVAGTWDSQGGSIVNPQNVPSAFQIHGTSTCTLIKVTGGNAAYYTVNAPTAEVTVSGGADVYGAFNARTVSLSGGGAIHYDTNLRNLGGHAAVVTLKHWKRY